MTTTTSLDHRLTEVKQRIADAAQRAGRHPDDVILCAVTKYAEPEQIRELAALGHQDFAENRIQHLVQRAAMFEEQRQRRKSFSHGSGDADGNDTSIRWHMIGHLQRNKARKAVEICRLIHSVDSLRLAEELNQIGLRREEPVEVLIQANCSGEEGKHGLPSPAALSTAEQIESMAYIVIRGVMTMAPYSPNPEDSRPTFERARELFADFKRAGIGEKKCNLLSMGMSGDFEVAVEEGANIIRVGSAIFGERIIDELPDEPG